jgi:hypothetical protein
MPLSTKDFAQKLYNASEVISLKFGSDLRQSDLPLRAAVATVCVLIGGTLRGLVMKGVATDTELVNHFTAIVNDSYPKLPLTAPVIDEENQNPTTPDVGGGSGSGTAPTSAPKV